MQRWSAAVAAAHRAAPGHLQVERGGHNVVVQNGGACNDGSAWPRTAPHILVQLSGEMGLASAGLKPVFVTPDSALESGGLWHHTATFELQLDVFERGAKMFSEG